MRTKALPPWLADFWVVGPFEKWTHYRFLDKQQARERVERGPMNNLQRRLAKLEEQITPAAEPIVIDVVFVDAATMQKTPGFQVTIPMSGYTRDRRWTGRSGSRGR